MRRRRKGQMRRRGGCHVGKGRRKMRRQMKRQEEEADEEKEKGR